MFGVSGKQTFVRQTIQVDKSSTNYYTISTQRNPEFETETVFLSKIVEGKANLYLYRVEGHSLFYFNKTGQPIQPLVYKIYESPVSHKKKENNRFQQQLATNLRCNNPKIKNLESIDYNATDLERVFIRYNCCIEYPADEESFDAEISSVNATNTATGGSQITEDEAPIIRTSFRRKAFGISIKPRLSFAQFSFGRNSRSVSSIKGDLSVRPALEFDYNFLKGDGRLSLFTEFVVQRFNLGGFATVNGERQKFNYLQIPIGLRYQFSSPNSSGSFFLNVAHAIGLPLSSDGQTTQVGTATTPGDAFVLGIGYHEVKRLSFEFRQSISGSFKIDNSVGDPTRYRLYSFIVGYRIL